MKPPSSVISDRHGHSGQKVLAHLAQLQQQNALLKESLALSQRENALQQELITKLQAQHTQQQKQITQQQEQIVQLQEKVEALEAEIRRVCGLNNVRHAGCEPLETRSDPSSTRKHPNNPLTSPELVMLIALTPLVPSIACLTYTCAA